MNERIQELAEQAEILFYKGRIPETGYEYEGAEVTKEDLQKFAELIIEECRYVMDCNKGSDQHLEWNLALSETSDKIKQHFGVK